MQEKNDIVIKQWGGGGLGGMGINKLPWNMKSLKNICCRFIWQGTFVKLSIVLINQATTQRHFLLFLLVEIIILSNILTYSHC